MKPRLAVLAALVLLAAAPSAAQAAGWQRVTTLDGSSIEQVGLVRSSDGVLHVAWHHRTGPNTEDLLHTAITPAGAIGATSPIQTGWTGFTNTALVIDPVSGGVRALWGGFRTTEQSDPQKEINTALSADGGASWVLQPGQVVPDGAQAYASPVSASVSGGTIFQAWYGTLGTWVHAGLSPASPNFDYQAPIGSYGNDPNIASDADGRTVMAWYSNANGHLGVLAQDVAADGSPVGSAATMPGTDDMETGMLGRTPLVARAGGGFYAAYPTGQLHSQVRLWRIGASRAPVFSKQTGNAVPVALAAAPDGRLWLAWSDNSSGAPRIVAARSNRKATRFGTVVSAGRAGKAQAAYRLDASAAPGGGLDLFGNFNDGTSSVTATYHRRILPGLTLRAAPGKVRKGKITEVRFTVVDAGAPVKGAVVRAAGKRGTTDSKGRVLLAITSRKAVKASAKHTGYVAAKKRLKVRR